MRLCPHKPWLLVMTVAPAPRGVVRCQVSAATTTSWLSGAASHVTTGWLSLDLSAAVTPCQVPATCLDVVPARSHHARLEVVVVAVVVVLHDMPVRPVPR